ncbi:putative oxidoreductase [Lachnellula hyalina]|uniref:Putative oxidoreductase n=1 Tax=Lachnellula hyalina TaxID=1316788 RepID=A0A8H8TZL5_9HELO|nr:putative oxidoreductase [Lachnellula hyalina]TVY25972.1 putative oxidoreductase [Lachnellula hyalina]
MTPKTLSFKCAIVTGGGGGIGRAMAEYLISINKKVLIVGRTEKNLAQTAKELGRGTSYYVLDTGDISSIPSFIKKVISEHPDVDCLINNAGVQRPLNVNNFELEKADQEININIRGPMHLAIGFLPHFKTKPAATIINVSSALGFIPFSIINPVYNGTKAWLHFWTLNLRTQLAKENVKVVEIAPPMVATDLHRERSDPDDNKKEKNSSTLGIEEFMEFVKKGLEADKDTIGAGMSEGIVDRWNKEFGDQYNKAAEGYIKG